MLPDKLTITIKRDKDGKAFIAVVKAEGLQGCHTQGPSLRKVLRRLEGALEVCDVDVTTDVSKEK